MVIEKGRWLIEASEDWSQLIKRCNWYNFVVIHIEPEWDKMLGSVEIKLGLLGFYVRASYCYNRFTPARVQIEKSMNEIMEMIENGEEASEKEPSE